MSGDPRALVRLYYDALNRRELDALDAIVAPDLQRHEPGAASGLAALKETIRAYHVGFPDLAHAVEMVVADAGLVAVRTRTTGTHLGPFLGHPPSGRRFSAAGQGVYRVDGGLIRELWGVFDTLSMLQQIGLYTPAVSLPDARSIHDPAPTLARGGRMAPGPRHGVTVAEVRSKPLEFLQGLTRDHGDVVRYVCDGRVTFLFNVPEAIRHVLHDRATNFSKLSTPDMLLLRPMLGEGLLTTEGSRWKSDRQLVQPLFARRQLARWGDVMVQVTEEMLARWDARPDPAAALDVPREMGRLTLEIAARTLLSSDFSSQSEAFGRAMDVLNESMGHVEPDAPEVQGRFRPALATIRRIIWQTILARKICDTGEDDLIALLLRAQRERGDTDRQIIDQAVTLLLAGHETTAKALSWTFALLDLHAGSADRLLAEQEGCLGGRAPAVDDLPALRWTRAVIHEALRLYPPIWLLTRTALADDEVIGYTVPAGALVSVSPYLIHRHSALWDRADEFFPERFLGGEAEEAAQGHRYLPFGHGPRHCLGNYFALLEMPLVLATIHSHRALTCLPGPPLEPEALVTLRPQHGLQMVVTSRPSPAPPRRANAGGGQS